MVICMFNNHSGGCDAGELGNTWRDAAWDPPLHFLYKQLWLLGVLNYVKCFLSLERVGRVF